jgi:oligopeptide/dipeptide ABC transporter ATP-binding protein
LVTAEGETSLLQLQGLCTEIQLRRAVVRAVEHVSLQVRHGEAVGLVGESGCGKTMTALSIMGLLPHGGRVSGGHIVFEDRDLTSLSDEEMQSVRGSEIGIIFQDPLSSLNPTKRVGEQIAEAVRLHRHANHAEAWQRAVEVLNMVGLPHAQERADEYPHQFSGGMRQRVMIAMALACEPKLLIADEPTTALDVTIQMQILDLLEDLRGRLGMATLLVTHDLGVIAGRTDRVAVMYAGRIVEVASTHELFTTPRHRYTEALFEALPEKAAETHDSLYSIPGTPPDLTRPITSCSFAPRCRHVQDDCVEREPALLSDDGHAFACLHPVEGATEVGQVQRRTSGASSEAVSGGDSQEDMVLSLSGIVKEYRSASFVSWRRRLQTVSAVAGVSFGVVRGTVFGLVGESGCGKTTIGRLIVGLEVPTAGRIEVDGVDLTKIRGRELRRRRRDVQLMFQDAYASLDPRMRVGEILREPLDVQHVGSRREREARVAELLEDVGLPDDSRDRYPHEFSGGQRQRLGFARALALRPHLIVADEPVSALDVSIQAQILNLMRDLQASLGLTYVLISHDLAVVRYMADTIGVLYLGKLVEVGPSDQLYREPIHPYTAALIVAVPVAEWRAEPRPSAVVVGELPSSINPPSGCRFRTRCPRAQGLCADEEPPLRPFSDMRFAACHFPLRPPETVGQR